MTVRFEACCILALAAILAACGGTTDTVEVPGEEGAFKSSAAIRAERRAYDGAPPVIPHASLGMDCTSCHNREGLWYPGMGFAPASPHDGTMGLSAMSRCGQCHVFSDTTELFRASRFEPYLQDLQPGGRLSPVSPPVVPHPVFMRENCIACHSGPAAREEIRTTHPERIRCLQCHVPVTAPGTFPPSGSTS